MIERYKEKKNELRFVKNRSRMNNSKSCVAQGKGQGDTNWVKTLNERLQYSKQTKRGLSPHGGKSNVGKDVDDPNSALPHSCSSSVHHHRCGHLKNKTSWNTVKPAGKVASLTYAPNASLLMNFCRNIDLTCPIPFGLKM